MDGGVDGRVCFLCRGGGWGGGGGGGAVLFCAFLNAGRSQSHLCEKNSISIFRRYSPGRAALVSSPLLCFPYRLCKMA